jgi:hypothetical protein
MARHREQEVPNFLRAAGANLAEQYFLRLFRREDIPPYLVGMNPDYVGFLLGRIDESLRAVILDEFHRISDICKWGKELPEIAGRRFDVPLPATDKPEAMAMRLFLDYPRAFSLAWALYAYRASYARISQHWLQHREAQVDATVMAVFASEMQAFFAKQDRGLQCQVDFSDSRVELAVWVLHGLPERTIPCWQGHKVAPNCFRPACEDVLIYDKSRGLLSVKVSKRGDVEQYVRSFARLVLGDASLADYPQRDLIYTPEPFQSGQFDWAGSGAVVDVERRGAKLNPDGSEDTVLEIAGKGVADDLRQGRLVEIKIKFTVECDGKKESVTGTLVPPCITDVVKKKHADLIADYLREKGVLLR